MKIAIFLLIVVQSCVVSYTPKYDAAIHNQVTQGANNTDAFYQKMLDASNKGYSFYANDYAAIENEIMLLVQVEGQRSKNTLLLPQITNIQKLFLKFEAEHQAKVNLNNSQISIYKQQIAAAWATLVNSENLLKH